MSALAKHQRARRPVRTRPVGTSRLARVARPSAALAAALLALWSPRPLWAQTIGDLEVRSESGERFFGAVPVDAGGRPVDPNCVRVRPHPDAGAQPLPSPRVRVNASGLVDTVLIETSVRVTEPLIGFRLEVGCDQPVTRDFLVRSEPVQAPATAPAPISPPVIAVAPPVPATPAERPRRAQSQGLQPRPAARAAVVPPAAPAEGAAPTRADAPPLAAVPKPKAKPAAGDPRLVLHHEGEVRQLEANPTLTDAQRDALKRAHALRGRDDEQLARILDLQHRISSVQAEAEKLKALLEQAAGVRTSAAPAAVAGSPAPGGSASTAQPGAVAQAPIPAAPSPSASAPTAASGPTAPQPGAAAPAEPPPATPAQAPAGAAPQAKPAPAPAMVTSTPAPRKEGWLGLPDEWTFAAIAAALLGVAGLGYARWKRSRPAPTPSPAPRPAPVARPSDHEKTVMLDSSPLAQRSPARPTPLTADHALPTMPVGGAATRAPDPIAPPTETAWAPAETLPRPVPASVADDGLHQEAPPTGEFPAAPETLDAPIGEIAGRTHPGGQSLAQRYVTDTQSFDVAGDPDAVVRRARIYYLDDGDPFKAIDLLEMAVAGRPGEPRLWHALFAIYRREDMAKRYELLARTYRGKFHDNEHWPAIQALGRAMDPENAFYAGAGADAAGDEVIERWLGVPLDFTAHLLSNELHDRLTGAARKRPGGGGGKPRA